jgi:L,D-transpeptidase catalytic domain
MRLVCLALLALVLVGCDDKKPGSGSQNPEPTSTFGERPQAESAEGGAPRPLSRVRVEHGELDRKAPEGAPRVAAITLASTVYKLPNTASRRLGYVRLGGILARDAEAVSGAGCKSNDWYRVYPMGYVCKDEFTTDLESPLVRASARRPALDKPLPYAYGFVRATAPQYLRIPSKADQEKSEFQLAEHMDWFRQNAAEVQTVVLGANDVPLDARGVAAPGARPGASFVPSTSMSIARLFGAEHDDEGPPFWLEGRKRAIPNISGFDVPEYAVFADRVRRHTGLSFVGSFGTEDAGLERRFGITVDLRLIPTSKVKPDTGSPFHGIEIPPNLELPIAWVNVSEAKLYELVRGRDEARAVGDAPKRTLVLLTGNARMKQGKRFYQTRAEPTRWLLGSELSIVHLPETWPEPAEKGQKWIDISVGQQTLVLYEGKTPRYATMISSGRDRFGDPKKDLATPLGDFRIQSKHIAAAMDSNENSTVSGGTKVGRSVSLDGEAEATIARITALKKSGAKMNSEDARRLANIEKGRHPEYGITTRRGSNSFELRDVPWIQYFSAGFALHGAYWHDVFGIPRSHGCVNLAPIDARLVFMWTDPPIPDGWHGLNAHTDTGEGTWVHIRK